MDDRTALTEILKMVQTEEERARRRLDEIERLKSAGLATFSDEAEAFRLRRKAVKRDFRGRHG